jgi:hypothetical protein
MVMSEHQHTISSVNLLAFGRGMRKKRSEKGDQLGGRDQERGERRGVGGVVEV